MIKLVKIILVLLLGNLISLFSNAAEVTEYYKLKNGMEVLLIQNDRTPLVTHTIWYRVGSINDPVKKSGIAHFLEHMMFKRFGNYSTGDYTNFVEKNGGLYNAFTNSYYTAYYATLPSNQLSKIMNLEAARMTQLKLEKIDREGFEKERLVVLDERKRRIEDSPEARLLEQMDYFNYRNNSFAIPVIGWESEIKNITLTDMKSFYEKYYGPNNSILVIAGDFEIAKTKKLIQDIYGSIEKTVPKNAQQYFPIDKTAVKGKFSLKDLKANNKTFHLYNFKPITKYNDKESYMIEGLGFLVANSVNSRLYQELVEKRNVAEFTDASIYCSPYHPCQFLISAQAKDKISSNELSMELDSLLKNIAENGITNEELILMKKVLQHSVHKFLYGSLKDKSLSYGLLLLQNYDISQILNLRLNYKKDINSITKNQMNMLAKDLFTQNYVKGILKKEKDDAEARTN